MQKNLISAVLTEEERVKVLDALAAVTAILQPKLLGLTVDERSSLSKMNDKTFPFGLKISSYCVSNPEFAPLYMDKVEFEKDLALYQELKPIADIVGQLNSDLSDTMMLAGSEAYEASRYYYNGVKYAAKSGNVKAKPIYADLAKRYPGPKGRAIEGDEPK